MSKRRSLMSRLTPRFIGEPLTQLPMKATLCGESAACRCWAAPPLELQIFRFKPRVLCDAGRHLRADLIFVVEGEDHVGPAGAREGRVGTRLPLYAPADAAQRREDALGFRGRPLAHAAAKEMLTNS